MDAALERFGRLDAVVANAGFQHVSPVRDFPEERWDALLAVLLTSPFLLAKYAWDALAASGDGRFCAISSVHGLVASPFKAGYVAGEARRARPREDDRARGRRPSGSARARSAPATCARRSSRRRSPTRRGSHGLPEERVLEEVMLAPQAVKRLLEPSEVADVVAFLLGPSGRAFTGAPVVIDLGWTAR